MKYNFKVDMSTDNSASIILRHINPGSCVLEFGPATGYMTRFMKEELGCTVYCIEKDREAAELAKNYCKKMIITDINSMEWLSELQTGFFDHIIFADVLEHLENPWKVLKAAVYYLKENGTVLTSVPNISHNAIIMELLQGRFDYQPLGLLDDSHIRFFTRKSVTELLDKAELHPVKWLCTVMHPENTEFRQRYLNFPESLQSYLIHREDAHVYQFITVSIRKSEAVSQKKDTEFHVGEEMCPGSFLQLFWEEEQGFTESNSVRVPMVYDSGFINYEFRIPSLNVKSLRLDPGNKYGYIQIKSINLYDSDPNVDTAIEPLIYLSAENDFFGLFPGPGVLKIKDKSFFSFIAINNDPQLFLNHHLFEERCKQYYLRIEMRASEILPGTICLENNTAFCMSYSEFSMLQEELINKDAQIKSQCEKIAKLQTEIIEHEEVIRQQNNQINELTGLISVLHRKLDQQNLQVQALLNSYSWKITAPLRWLGQAFGRGNKKSKNLF